MTKHLFIVSSVLGLLLLAQIVLADWSPPDPSDTPAGTCASGHPGCDAPINVGGLTQTKQGSFAAIGLRATSDLYVDGQTGIGTTSAAPNTKMTVSIPNNVAHDDFGLRFTRAGDSTNSNWFMTVGSDGRYAGYLKFGRGNNENAYDFAFDVNGNLNMNTGKTVNVGNNGGIISFNNANSSLYFFDAVGNVELSAVNNLLLDGGGQGNTRIFIKGSTGNVGIGNTSPGVRLDVTGLMRANQSSSPTCNSSVEGGIFYNTTDKHFYGCDGTSWRQLDN